MTSNTELLDRRHNAVARGVFSATPIFAERAKNAELWDADGKRYIDFAVGIAVCNTGHCHPKIMAAAKQQCDLFTHTAFQVVAYETYISLAERLNELAPIEDAKSLFFSTDNQRATGLCSTILTNSLFGHTFLTETDFTQGSLASKSALS